VRIWDLESMASVYCLGHENCVRAYSAWADNPFCFVTGARDGHLLMWDTRDAVTQNSHSHIAHLKILNAHPSTDHSKILNTSASNTIRKRSVGGSQLKKDEQSKALTSVLCEGENMLLSASTSSASGIRLWDMRYQKISALVKTYEVPQSSVKSSGLTSMCYHSSFFAACTDNNIYEYTKSKTEEPENTYVGTTIKSFYVQCAASPVSDHLLCGSFHGCAMMWDLQERRRYRQDAGPNLIGYNHASYLPRPKYQLDGHKNEVFTVGWSSKGRYIVTMDQQTLRIWDSQSSDEDEKKWLRAFSRQNRNIDMPPPARLQPRLLEPQAQLVNGSGGPIG